MALSFRGAERQAPSVISLALRFSQVLKEQADCGAHPASWNTEKRLQTAVDEFHSSSLMTSKWRLDEEKFRSILNVIQGATPEALAMIQSHLHLIKWKECAFTTLLLRSTRWLLGAGRKVDQSYRRSILIVNEETQAAVIQNHINHYLQAIRRVRPSARPKCRATVDQFEKLVDYICVMMQVLKDAKKAFPDKTAVHDAIQKAMADRPQ
jgi:hypothetical protein